MHAASAAGQAMCRRRLPARSIFRPVSTSRPPAVERGRGTEPDGGPPGDCYCFIHVTSIRCSSAKARICIVRRRSATPRRRWAQPLTCPPSTAASNCRYPPARRAVRCSRSRAGMPDPRRHGRGRLMVQVHVEVPHALTPEHEAMLRRLAEIENANVSPCERVSSIK